MTTPLLEPKSMKPEQNANEVVLDFTDPLNRENWRVSNDNVMGGRSKGGVDFSSDLTTFSGTISLENNGGFSAVFYKIRELDSNYEHIELDAMGDGQSYQLRVVTNNNGRYIQYAQEFKTVANIRSKTLFSLKDFQATFRGRNIDNAPALKSEDIFQVGLLFKKKSEDDFSLALFSATFLK